MPFTLFSGGELSGKYFVTVQNSGARHSFCNISFSYFYMWHCGTFSEQSWPTIGNLLDRRLVQYFCTITTVTRYLVYYMNRIWTLLFLDERHPKEYQRAFSLEIHGERKAYVCKQKHLLLQRICKQNIQLQFHWLRWMDFIAFFACVTVISITPITAAR